MRYLLSIVLLCVAVPFAQAVEPDQMSMEELEAYYGPNFLEPDPAGLGPPPGVPDDTVLQRWYGSAPGSMNALLHGDAGLIDSLMVYCCLDLALRHRDQPSRWAPGAADYASAAEDLSYVTVRIRKGIHWQFPAVDREDPKYAWLVKLFEEEPPELTAEDVRFTLEMMLDPNAQLDKYQSYYGGTSIEVLDRYTFRMHWDHFYIYARELAISWQQVLPRFLYSRDEDGRLFSREELGAAFREHWYNNRICGYGPYEYVSMDPDVEIVVRRMDDFPVFRPAIREIHWQITRDAEATVLRLLDGQLDFTTLQPEQYRKYVLEASKDSPFRNGTYVTKEYEQVAYFYLGWNCRRPPLDDARVRNALALAFHREAFLDRVFFGLGGLVDSHVFHRHPHYNSNLKPILFDLRAASRLLDEAGWGDEDGDGVRDKKIGDERVPLRISMLTFAGSVAFETMLSVYREDLKKIGVDMVIEPLPWSQMKPRIYSDHDFDAFTGSIGLGWEVDFYDAFHSDGSNCSGFSNPEADELIVRYRETTDDAVRRDAALRVQEILHQEQPYTFFMRQSRTTVFPPWLKNVEYAVARPQLVSFGWYASKSE